MVQNHPISEIIEHQLVLAAISLDRSEDVRISELLKEGVNWERLFNLTIQQGVFPLFYRRLKAIESYQIPKQEITRWEEVMKENSQKSLRLAWKMIRLVDLLSEIGIESVVLKGPAMAIQAYGDLLLRPFSDLDILIHPEDFPAVYDLMIRSGYTPKPRLEPNQKKLQVRSDNHLPFLQKGDVIEVHWNVVPPKNLYPITSAQMWQGLTHFEIAEKTLNSLSLENNILFTCIHGTKHKWRQLKWIADLAHLCQSGLAIDWGGLLDRSQKIGFFQQVCLGLLLAEKLGGLVLPSAFRDRIQANHNAQNLASEVMGSLFSESDHPGIFVDYGFYLRSRERFIDRFYYLYEMIIVPKQVDWLAFPLPEKLYPFYYLFRPLRLLFIIGRSALSSLF